MGNSEILINLTSQTACVWTVEVSCGTWRTHTNTGTTFSLQTERPQTGGGVAAAAQNLHQLKKIWWMWNTWTMWWIFMTFILKFLPLVSNIWNISLYFWFKMKHWSETTLTAFVLDSLLWVWAEFRRLRLSLRKIRRIINDNPPE